MVDFNYNLSMLLIKVKLQNFFLSFWSGFLLLHFLLLSFADCGERMSKCNQNEENHIFCLLCKSNICFIPPVVLHRSLWPRHEICTKRIKVSAEVM